MSRTSTSRRSTHLVRRQLRNQLLAGVQQTAQRHAGPDMHALVVNLHMDGCSRLVSDTHNMCVFSS